MSQSFFQRHLSRSQAFLRLQERRPDTARHIEQGLGFAIAGSIGAAIDLSALPLLVEFGGFSESLSFILSSAIATSAVFLFNKYITFRSHGQPVMAQMLKFAAVYGTSIAMNGALSTFFHWLGAQYIVAKILAIGVGMIWNYLLSHSFVFKHSTPTA